MINRKTSILVSTVIVAVSLTLLPTQGTCAGREYVCVVPPGRSANTSRASVGNGVKFVDGIPLLSGSFWHPSEGGSAVINTGGILASRLYIFGGLNSVDRTHPAWGGGNGFENFFFGSRTGEIRIEYSSGRTDTIPLVVGYTSWIHYNYKISPEPFKSHPDMAKLLDNALCVANGLRGYENDAGGYYLVIALRRAKIQAIELCDNPDKIGYFKVNGLTFDRVSNKGALPDSAFLNVEGRTTSNISRQWVDKHLIQSSDGYPVRRRGAIAKLRLKFDTQPCDINSKIISETKPEITAENFKGPKVKFSGSPTAELMTRIYYENAQQMLSRIDSTGMVHESAKGADNFNGIGTWTAGLAPFYTDSYTRIRVLTLLSNMGYSKKVNSALDYYDKWAMYFPDSYPKLELGGKPVPAHATVIANKPLIYSEFLSKHGWPTKYKNPDFGNGENDGHGMLMLSRWHAWLKQGMKKSWVNKRWNVIKATTEYIPWCLENPKLSFSQHGLLYSESEGGMQMESMFCDLNCYLGLLGSVDMAKATGRMKWAKRWQRIADAYLDSMNLYYPITMKRWGDVWNPAKTATWSGGFATLAPAFIGMDYWGYDVMNRLPPGWAERTRRTYRMELTHCSPPYAATAGIGYGQGYLTESALLMDNMSDATKMVDWIAKICFAPRLQHPYRVPEGSVVEGDGSIWRRWGDLGNLYQLGEVEYTIQVILGIDDVNPNELVLMPRMPLDWNRIRVRDWPVRTFSKGKSQRCAVSITDRREGNEYRIVLRSDKVIDHGKIRIGPFNISSNSISVMRDGKRVPAKSFVSGDSRWVWVVFGNGKTKTFEITGKAL